jgi:hypothetical protein
MHEQTGSSHRGATAPFCRELRDEMSGKRHFKLPLCPNEVDLGRRGAGPLRGDLRQKAASAAKLR